MVKDPAVKLKLAANYANVANYWKFFDGESRQLKKFRTYEEKQQAYENKFAAWASCKPGYENILLTIQRTMKPGRRMPNQGFT